jgi:DNA-binding MarR family transcriptional regulator
VLQIMSQPKSISPEQAATHSVYEALKPFREYRKPMPLQYVTVFLLVASDENQNFSTYATRQGTSQSLMSRHIADLGKVNRYHKPGFGLVETYDDLMDRRNKLVRLTPRGRHIVLEMSKALQSANMPINTPTLDIAAAD